MLQDGAFPETQAKKLIVGNKTFNIGQTVFFRQVEEHWDKPYVKKRHHTDETRSVILQGKIEDIKDDEFMAKLFGNNGFEKDGETFVFHKGNLLCEQNFTDKKRLGVWKQDPSSNP